MNQNEKFIKVFSSSLAIPTEAVTDALEYNSLPEWDSTAHMVLIAELENQFDVMLDTDDIIDMSSVRMAKKILRKYNIQIED